MKNLKSLGRLILVFSCAISTVCAQNLETVQSADDMNRSINILLKAEDYGTQERSILLGFSAKVVPILVTRIQNAPNKDEVTNLMSLLSVKLVQLDGSIPQPSRESAIDALIAQCENSTDMELRARLANFLELNDPKIDSFISRLATKGNDSQRDAATAFLRHRKEVRNGAQKTPSQARTSGDRTYEYSESHVLKPTEEQ